MPWFERILKILPFYLLPYMIVVTQFRSMASLDFFSNIDSTDVGFKPAMVSKFFEQLQKCWAPLAVVVTLIC